MNTETENMTNTLAKKNQNVNLCETKDGVRILKVALHDEFQIF